MRRVSATLLTVTSSNVSASASLACAPARTIPAQCLLVSALTSLTQLREADTSAEKYAQPFLHLLPPRTPSGLYDLTSLSMPLVFAPICIQTMDSAYKRMMQVEVKSNAVFSEETADVVLRPRDFDELSGYEDWRYGVLKCHRSILRGSSTVFCHMLDNTSHYDDMFDGLPIVNLPEAHSTLSQLLDFVYEDHETAEGWCGRPWLAYSLVDVHKAAHKYAFADTEHLTQKIILWLGVSFVHGAAA